MVAGGIVAAIAFLVSAAVQVKVNVSFKFKHILFV